MPEDIQFLTQQANVQQEMRTKQVGQIFDEMFRRQEFTTETEAAEAKAKLDRQVSTGEMRLDVYKLGLDAQKVKLEEERTDAQVRKDTKAVSKLDEEIRAMKQKTDVIQGAMDEGITDPNLLDVGRKAILNVKQIPVLTQNKDLRNYILKLEGVSEFSGLKKEDQQRVADASVKAEEYLNQGLSIAQAAAKAQRWGKTTYRIKKLQKRHRDKEVVYAVDEATGIKGFYDNKTGKLIEEE